MIKRYKTIKSYWEETSTLLLKDPVKNNIIIGQCLSVKDQDKELENWLLINVYENNQIVLTAFKNHPNLVLVGDNFSSNSLEKLKLYLIEHEIKPQGVICSPNLVEEYAKLENMPYSVSQRLIYKLNVFNEIDFSEGKMLLSTLEDLNLVSDWIYQFQIDCNLVNSKNLENLRIDTLKLIDKKKIYKWVVNSEVVSICAEMVSNDYFSKISLVYTPPQLRKKNYARSCVWSLTKLILNRGQKTICLFTEKSNPTSNKIYREIGFDVIAENSEIRFEY